MSSELILDVVKILGPAIVTAIVSYKVAKIQIDIKKIEVTKNNQYKAREKIFDYEKEKIEKIETSTNELRNMLYSMAGYISEGISKNDTNWLFFSSTVKNKITVLASEFKSLSFKLSEQRINYEDEYEELEGFVKEIDCNPLSLEPDSLQETIMRLIDMYTFIGSCLQSIAESEAKKIFQEYLN